MGKSYSGSSQIWSFLDPNWSAKAVTFLRALYPTKTAERVSDDLTMSENTVRKWLTRQSSPNGDAVLKMVFFYGPEFVAAVAPRAFGWLSKAVIDARQERIEADQARIDRDRRELGL